MAFEDLELVNQEFFVKGGGVTTNVEHIKRMRKNLEKFLACGKKDLEFRATILDNHWNLILKLL